MATTQEPGVSETTRRGVALRRLARAIARTRRAVAQQTTHREGAIREWGPAHPRTIAATHRLHRTRSIYRRLQQRALRVARDLGYRTQHDHRGPRGG